VIIIQETGLFVLKPNSLTFEVFRDNAKIADGTYANDLIANLYDTLIGDAKGVRRDYNNYFADEYESFNEFVKHRFKADKDCIKKILRNLDTHEVIYHKKPEYGYVGIIEMLLCEGYIKVIDRLMEP
jgi:hypothetical protein